MKLATLLTSEQDTQRDPRMGKDSQKIINAREMMKTEIRNWGDKSIKIPACMKSREPVGETPLLGHKIMLLSTTKVFQYKP